MSRAPLLKHLVSHEMMAGQVVDWQVNRALDAFRAGQPEPLDLVERGEDAWTQMLVSSRTAAQRMREGKSIPRGAQPLLVDYYGIDEGSEREDRSATRVAEALRGFQSCQAWEKLRQVPVSRWSPSKENWEIKAEEWELEGVRVWCALDLWLDYGDRGIVIIDWKSGYQGGINESLQLATYSLWGQVAREYEREQVLIQAVHLPECPDLRAKPVSETETNAARATILEENARETALVVPIARENGLVVLSADRSKFQPSPVASICLFCKFREICPEGQAEVDKC